MSEFESGFERRWQKVADPERQRVTDFTGTLARIDEVRIDYPEFDFSDAQPVRAAEQRFVNSEHTGKLTFYINEEAGMADDQKEFEFIPRIARSGKRTNHGVFFGDLRTEEAQIPVAVKPHRGNSAKTCLADYFNNCAVRKLGFHTLKPLGFIIGSLDAKQAYSLTHLEEGLTTLDSIDWSDYFPNTHEHPGMLEIWREISDQVALMHASGNMSHGDLAARNIAVTPEETREGGLFLIDWELAYITGSDSHDPIESYKHSYLDLQKLLESVCSPPHAENITPGLGILYGKQGDWWQAFKQIFFDEYQNTRLALAFERPKPKQKVLAVKAELKLLESSLEEDAEMMYKICNDIPPA